MIGRKDSKILNRFSDNLDSLMAMKRIDYKTVSEVKSILSRVLNIINYKNPYKIISVNSYREKLELSMINKDNGDEIGFDIKEYINALCDCLSIEILKIDTYIKEGSKLKTSKIQSKYISLVTEKLDKSEMDLIGIVEILNEFLNCETDFEVGALLLSVYKEEGAA